MHPLPCRWRRRARSPETFEALRCAVGPEAPRSCAACFTRSLVVFLEVPLLVRFFLFGERCVGRNASLFCLYFYTCRRLAKGLGAEGEC